LAASFAFEEASAQTMFEDTQGETAVTFPSGGLARINTKDSSFKFAYTDRTTGRKYRLGFTISGKANDGVALLFRNKKVNAGAEVSVTAGQYLWGKQESSRLGWISAGFVYRSSRYTIYSAQNTFDKQIETENYNGFSGSFNGAYLDQLGDPLQYIIGLSLTVRRDNNYQTLEQVLVTDAFSVTDSVTGINRTVESTTQARMGVYEEYTSVPLYVDLVVIPAAVQDRLGVSGYSRTTFAARTATGDKITRTDVGVGIYFLQDGAPRQVIGGLIGEIEDISDASARNNSIWDRSRISLVAGYHFN
jgi:hypothetical protein